MKMRCRDKSLNDKLLRCISGDKRTQGIPCPRIIIVMHIYISCLINAINYQIHKEIIKQINNIHG